MRITKGLKMHKMNENFNRDNWCAPSVSELAKDLEEAVKDLWDHRDEGGCCHWPIYYEENGKEWDVALGWAEGYEEDPNIYYDDGYAICASVRYQTAHNAMQTDLNIDFLMPCYEGGDCWDTDCTISKEEDYTYLAKYLLDEGKKMVEEFADKDVEDDEDMDESRLRRGRSLRESRRPRGRMLKEGKNTEHYVWCRVGMTLKLTEDEIRKMKKGGDVGFLYEKIADAEPDGELYIPTEVLDELAKVDGLPKSLCGDEIEVQL